MTMFDFSTLTSSQETAVVTSMALPEASPAKMQASPTLRVSRDRASMEPELDYGARLPDWPMRFDPSSCCWKTCQGSLVPGLDEFSGTWPKSGMMRSGVSSPHSAPDFPTAAKGSGLLPTPAARDFRDLSAGKAFLSQRKRHSPSLATKLLDRGVHWTHVSEAYEVAMGFASGWTDLG